MKTLRKFSKIITVVAILAMVLSFASCKKGSLELKSFTVDRTSVKTNYLIGEEIDFSGIKATVKYNDESYNKVYTYDELTITYAEDITATEGDKEVTVSFDDPNLGVKQETKVAIKVTKEPVVDETDPAIVTQFEQPDGLTAFNSANASAGKSEYGSTTFSGEFALGNQIYVIGNENAFILKPKVAAFNESDVVVELTNFFATVDISIYINDAYVALTKVAGEGNIVEYYNDDTLIATVDTYKGEYNFSADAAGAKVKISVLPSEKYYISDHPAVVLEAKVIAAYNVYEAWQLAVIDNFNAQWDAIKTEHGIKDLNVSGVVFHNDITVTANDVPADFFRSTTEEVVYKNSATGAEIKIPAGTKYLYDWTYVYHRVGAGDFAIKGNFFTLDMSDFPIVPSPAVFNTTTGDSQYGDDFSNATLFKFDTTQTADIEKPDDVAIVEFDNLNMIGNASRDNLVDADGNLASAGGLILVKASYFSEVTMKNTIGNSFFISYFSDCKAVLNAESIKCYDSYQNAGMVWGIATLTFKNSYLNGTGGPVVIATSEETGTQNPVLTLTNTIAETHLTGEEIWFTATGANTMMDDIKALAMGLNAEPLKLGSFIDANGKMNLKGLLMADATSADAIVIGAYAQGYMFFDNNGIERILSETPTTQNAIIWKQIYEATMGAMAGGKIPPFFTVNDAEGNIAAGLYFNGTTFVDLFTNMAIGTDPSHDATIAAFKAADHITLTQGGMSVTFEFYH